MHGTCYIRNVVPCGLGHRLIVSRGRRNIYEFNDGKVIDGYSYTVVTDILRMQRWEGDTPAAPIFIYFSFFPTEIMHTHVRGRHPSCTQFTLAKHCILRWGRDTPAAPFTHSLNLAYLVRGRYPGCTRYTLTKPFILGWGGDTPTAPFTHTMKLAYCNTLLFSLHFIKQFQLDEGVGGGGGYLQLDNDYTNRVIIH